MSRLKSNDEVIVIAGKDKGQRGKILKVLLKHNELYYLVSGVNMVKKHQKPNPSKNTPGGIVEKEAYIHSSNVAIWNEATQKADRVVMSFDDESNKVRIFKSSKQAIDQ